MNYLEAYGPLPEDKEADLEFCSFFGLTECPPIFRKIADPDENDPAYVVTPMEMFEFIFIANLPQGANLLCECGGQCCHGNWPDPMKFYICHKCLEKHKGSMSLEVSQDGDLSLWDKIRRKK